MMFLIFVVLNCIGLGWIQKKLPNASIGLQLAFSTMIFLLWICFGGIFLGHFHILHRWSATIWIGIFVLYSMQDWSNWSFALANNMIYQIAAFAWLIFGVLLVWFALGDLRESRNG